MSRVIDGFRIIARLQQVLFDWVGNRVHPIHKLRLGEQDMTNGLAQELESFNRFPCFRE
jgi:hypothetical protein